MSGPDHAQRERAELSDLFADLGPDAPTLCEGWTTRDLAAHLIVRESRPDAILGINGGPTAGWTARVTQGEARNDYSVLVDKVRHGPPTLSFFSLPGADANLNLAEFAVHHEDVLRAQPGWQAREIPEDFADALWGRISLPARRTFGNARTGVTLARTDGSGGSFVAHSGEPMVTITGPTMDVLLLAYGRRAVHVTVTADGDDAAVVAFTARYLTA